MTSNSSPTNPSPPDEPIIEQVGTFLINLNTGAFESNEGINCERPSCIVFEGYLAIIEHVEHADGTTTYYNNQNNNSFDGCIGVIPDISNLSEITNITFGCGNP